jgi:hypothetical protein
MAAKSGDYWFRIVFGTRVQRRCKSGEVARIDKRARRRHARVYVHYRSNHCMLICNVKAAMFSFD